MTTPTHDNPPISLVLGGTGKTGRRVAERLLARGEAVRIGSRSADPPFDWDDRTSWTPVLRDVTKAYVCFAPDLAVPGAAETVAAFTDLAVRQGVTRLVLLSGRGEPEAQRSEEAVLDAGLEATVLRASWFSQNFSEAFLLDSVRSGVVALPVDGVGEPFLDADDIADAAVVALTEDGHAGQLYEMTGPRLLTFADAVREIAEASGREVAFLPVTMQDYAETLVAYDVPPDVVGMLTYLFTEVLDGRNASTTDGVSRVLGRAPRDFRDYAVSTAATGVWNG